MLWALLKNTHNMHFYGEMRKQYQYFSIAKSALSGAMGYLTVLEYRSSITQTFVCKTVMYMCAKHQIGYSEEVLKVNSCFLIIWTQFYKANNVVS